MSRMEELVELLNKASDAYFNHDREIMSNYQYDHLFDELNDLECETGIVLKNSPTIRAGIMAMSELEKVQHEYDALSLAKTKETAGIVKWANGKEIVLSWKLDGLTIINTWDNGKLVRSETRGSNDDNLGEDITHNSRYFKGLPQTIPYKGHLVVRGEATITYSECERINNELNEDAEPYKNATFLAFL